MSVSEVADATTTGRDGVLYWRDRLTICCAPSELLAVVMSITPLAGLTSGLPSLGVTSGMPWRPLMRAAVTRSLQPVALAFTFGQNGVGLTMMPTNGGPPLLANRAAYSPIQSPDQSSCARMTGLRSSTGNSPWGPLCPASSVCVQAPV